MALFNDDERDALKKGLAFGGISSALDTGFGTLGNLIGMPFEIAREKRNYALQYQYNEQAAENAFNRQVEFWNMQNRYNDPSAQLARLQKAGLNPALMNGGVQGNTAGGLSSVPNATVSNSASTQPVIKLMNFAQMAQLLKESDLLDAQTKDLIQAAANKEIDTIIKSMLGKGQWLEIKDKARTMGYTIDSDTLDKFFGIGDEPTPDGKSPTMTDIKLKEAQTNDANKKAYLNDTLAAVENSLVVYKQQLLNMQAGELQQKVTNLRKEYEKMEKEIQSLDYDNQVKYIISQLNNFYGTDISNLPAELIYKAGSYYSDVVNGRFTYESTLDAFNQAVNKYIDHNTHIRTDHGTTWNGGKVNVSFLKGLLGFGYDAGGVGHNVGY